MEQYTTSIKDLVILPLSNGSEIKAKAESGDAFSCLQIGKNPILALSVHPID
jgi:hypothetical protein